MTPLVWSFVLSALGIVGILLAGSKRKVGWLVGLAVQPLWIVFAISTGQYGFVLNAVVYAAVYARNWVKWLHEERATSAWEERHRVEAQTIIEEWSARRSTRNEQLLEDAERRRPRRMELERATALRERATGRLWHIIARHEDAVSVRGSYPKTELRRIALADVRAHYYLVH